MDHAIRQIEKHTGGSSAVLSEVSLSALESSLQRTVAELEPTVSYPFSGCGDVTLGRLCYLVVRLSNPQVVLETGVLYGMTSAYILEALAQNGTGVLHSVDLPPAREGSERLMGCLVPDSLRSRWHLHRGAARRVLPGLLPRLGPIGLFVHDSLHTYRNMNWEFRAVTPRLTEHAVVISDDVQSNAAFGQAFSPWSWSATVRQENNDKLVGVALRNGPIALR